MRRHAMQLQKAFVINPSADGTHLAHHPAKYLATTDAIALARANAMATGKGGVIVGMPEFKMNRHEELAALISFFTSTTSSALPRIDPSEPLDPREWQTT